MAILPHPFVSAAIDVDTLILATAMAALGVSTQFRPYVQPGSNRSGWRRCCSAG